MERVIPLRPALVELTGDVVSALILQQLCFWTTRVDDAGWVTKTSKELARELSDGVSRRTVSRRLKDMEEAELIDSRPSKEKGRQSTDKDYRVRRGIPGIDDAIEASAPPQGQRQRPGQNDQGGWTNCPNPSQKPARGQDKMTKGAGQIDQTPSGAPPRPGQNVQGVGQNDQPPGQIDQRTSLESTSPQTPTGSSSKKRAPATTPDFDNAALASFVQSLLLDHGISFKINDPGQVAVRLELSELEPDDYRRYLADDVPRLRQKIEAGETTRQKAIDWLGGSRAVEWWRQSMQEARKPKSSNGATAGKTRMTVDCDAVDYESAGEEEPLRYDPETNSWISVNPEETDATP